jgi:hypothetical protein
MLACARAALDTAGIVWCSEAALAHPAATFCAAATQSTIDNIYKLMRGESIIQPPPQQAQQQQQQGQQQHGGGYGGGPARSPYGGPPQNNQYGPPPQQQYGGEFWGLIWCLAAALFGMGKAGPGLVLRWEGGAAAASTLKGLQQMAGDVFPGTSSAGWVPVLQGPPRVVGLKKLLQAPVQDEKSILLLGRRWRLQPGRRRRWWRRL